MTSRIQIPPVPPAESPGIIGIPGLSQSRRTFSFAPETAEQIEKLRDGHRFDKIGSRLETLVQHIRSPWEVAITDTDSAFRAASR